MTAVARDPRDVGLAAVPASFWEHFADGAQVGWLSDGYPCKVGADDTVVAHPMYGAYAVHAYLTDAQERDDATALAAACQVASASVQRMSEVGQALVFWYEPEWGLSSWVTRRHFSALTQAYYAAALAALAARCGDDRFLHAAHRCYAALLVPIEQGGVLRSTPAGPAFEQVPTRPASLVLNGWLSTLMGMWQYATHVDSDEAREVVRASARTIAALAHLYDAPGLLNSRYSLAAYAYARLCLPRAGARLHRVVLEIPGEEPARLPLGRRGRGGTSRWTSFVFDDDVDGEGQVRGRIVRLNVVLSRLAFPRASQVRLLLDSPASGAVALQLFLGRYSPLTNSPVDCQWREVDSLRLVVGANDVRLRVGWDDVPLVGYPTNFIKQVGGRHVNVYHRRHVERLRELAACTGIAGLESWASTWERYMSAWGSSPLYAEVASEGTDPPLSQRPGSTTQADPTGPTAGGAP